MLSMVTGLFLFAQPYLPVGLHFKLCFAGLHSSPKLLDFSTGLEHRGRYRVLTFDSVDTGKVCSSRRPGFGL